MEQACSRVPAASSPRFPLGSLRERCEMVNCLRGVDDRESHEGGDAPIDYASTGKTAQSQARSGTHILCSTNPRSSPSVKSKPEQSMAPTLGHLDFSYDDRRRKRETDCRRKCTFSVLLEAGWPSMRPPCFLHSARHLVRGKDECEQLVQFWNDGCVTPCGRAYEHLAQPDSAPNIE
jgi:hypothetical protein